MSSSLLDSQRPSLGFDRKAGGSRFHLSLGSRRVATVGDFHLDFCGDRWGLRKGNIRFKEARRRAGRDGLGRFMERALAYEIHWGLPFEFVVRIYGRVPVVYFRLECHTEDRLFGTGEVGGMNITELPGWDGGYYATNGARECGGYGANFTYCEFPCADKSYLPPGGAPGGTDPTRPPSARHFIGAPHDWINFALWAYRRGPFCATMPVSGGGAASHLRGTPDGFGAAAVGGSAKHIYTTVPLAAMAFGPTAAATTELVARAVQALMENSFHLRVEKYYPDALKGLGWCSYNAVPGKPPGKPTERQVLAELSGLLRKKMPVRFAVLDAGWQAEDKKGWIAGFDTNRRFPSGLAGLARKIKAAGVSHFGVWHTLATGGLGAHGAPGGLSPDSDWSRQHRHLIMKGTRRYWCVNPAGAGEFFDRFHHYLRSRGVDFVKCDFQGMFRNWYFNTGPINRVMGALLEGMEAAVDRHFGRAHVINCMSQNPECYYHYGTSNLMRAGNDYVPWTQAEGNYGYCDGRTAAKFHIVDSLFNSLWVSQLTWPDFDMFQTHHPRAEILALMVTLSGGPVYTTDQANRFKPDVLWKICTRDGRVLRPDAPVLPTDASCLRDPYADGVAIMAAAPCRGAGLLAGFNAGWRGRKAKAVFRARDSRAARAERYLCSLHYAKTTRVVRADESIHAALPELGAELAVFVPIVKGIAVQGLADKYVSPAGVESVTRSENMVCIVLIEVGRLMVYCDRPTVSIEDGCGRLARTARRLRAGQYGQEQSGFSIMPRTREIRITLAGC